MLVIPGAEVTKNHARARKNAHILALGIERFISADLVDVWAGGEP